MSRFADFHCRRLLLIFLAAICGFQAGFASATAEVTAGRGGNAIVALIVDYGDGVQKRFDLAWKNEMTVYDALKAAAEHPRGIKFESRGKAETVFVSKIDDCENEGSGRNWTYRVNDKPATQSCGVAKVEDGDVILWRFLSSR